MKLCKKMKDGGPESPVDGYFLIEIKWLFSIVLLKFNPGGREAFHSHAFNAWSWYLRGRADEHVLLMHSLRLSVRYWRGLCRPKYTPRDHMHRVHCVRATWCLSVRGPWRNWWQEYNLRTGELTTLTHGRETAHICTVVPLSPRPFKHPGE